MVALQFADGSTHLGRWETEQLGRAVRGTELQAAVLDIPIGLPVSGPRACDLAARRLLGQPRGTSVFPAPLRPMLAATTYQEAQAIRRSIDGKGCSRQAFGIQAKVAEIDRLVRASGATRLYEGHPELVFRELAGAPDLPASKHSRAGRLSRWHLLRDHFPALQQIDPERPSNGDSLDAYACLWTARRLVQGGARWLPTGSDQLDPELKIRMRIWF